MRNGAGTGAGPQATVESSGPVGDHQRTTLSFLLATFAVATSAFLGLGQAAASATTVESVPMDGRAFPLKPAQPDSAHPSTSVASKPLVPSEDRLATLERLERLPGAIDGSSPIADPSTTTQVDAVRVEAVRVEATSSSTTTVARSDTMAIREWQPVSQATFQGFVEECDFTTVEYVTPALVHGTIVEDDQRVNVVLVHRSAAAPLRVSPAHRGREPVGDWAREIGATVGINANWYNPFDGPAVSTGRVYGGSDHGYTALFGFTADGDLVADHHHKIHDRVDPRVVEGVSGHPTLIRRGIPSTDFGVDPTFSQRHPRTAIGVSASVDVLILVTVDGRQTDAVGMTGAETTSLLQRLGAHDAVMLDGGGSSAMWISGKGIVNRQSDSGRAVGNQIAVFGR